MYYLYALQCIVIQIKYMSVVHLITHKKQMFTSQNLDIQQSLT